MKEKKGFSRIVSDDQSWLIEIRMLDDGESVTARVHGLLVAPVLDLDLNQCLMFIVMELRLDLRSAM